MVKVKEKKKQKTQYQFDVSVEAIDIAGTVVSRAPRRFGSRARALLPSPGTQRNRWTCCVGGAGGVPVPLSSP